MEIPEINMSLPGFAIIVFCLFVLADSIANRGDDRSIALAERIQSGDRSSKTLASGFGCLIAYSLILLGILAGVVYAAQSTGALDAGQ